MGRSFIYALADPRTEAVRYIGQSSTGMVRPRSHWQPSELRDTGHLHSTRWAASLLQSGVTPAVRVLEEVQANDLDLAEMFWIAQAKGLGWDLTNHTAGGGGHRGFKPSPETLARLSRAHKGKKHSPEHIKACSDARRGSCVSEATKALLRAANLGKHPSEETRAKLSVAIRAGVVGRSGRPWSDGERASHEAVPLATECRRGHSYIPANTVTDKAGRRVCRTCKQARDRKSQRLYRAKQWSQR